MKKKAFGLTAVAALLIAAPVAHAETINVQSTTDTVDAGLVNGLLIPAYKAAQPGDSLNYVGVGTGAALDNARRGLADVVITHAPSLEQQFQNDGFSFEGPGRQIFYSDYVIVGPQSDPANVAGDAPHNAIRAFEDIARAGAAGRATFVTRNDNSGTNVQEQIMWGMAQNDLAADGITMTNVPLAGATTTGFHPTDTTWYRVGLNGQGRNLQLANDCPAASFPNQGCYTMVDRGTYNNLLNSGTLAGLKIVSQNNSPDAPGGQDLLINPFSAYIVNPARIPTVQLAAAQRFVNFLTSPGFQAQVDAFPTATNPAFHADAFPAVTVTTAPPATASANQTVSTAVQLANRIPGQPVPVGMPVTLQASTDNGTTWTNVGTSNTDASGNAGFSARVSATTQFRVSTDFFKGTSWSQFSPSTQPIGTTTVAAAPKPTPLRPDTAPKVSKLVLSPRKLAMTVDKRSTVKVTIKQRVSKRVRKNGHVRTVVSFKTVRTLSHKATKASRFTLTWKKALPAGTYRIGIRSTDAAHKSRVQRPTKVLKAAKKPATKHTSPKK